MNTNNGVETKVLTATIGAGSGFGLGTTLVWLIGVLAFNVPADAAHEAAAIAVVPTNLAIVLQGVLAAGLAFVGGYAAQHTPRLEELIAALQAIPAAAVEPAPGVLPSVDGLDESNLDSGAPSMADTSDNASLLATDGTENVQPFTGVPEGFDDGRDPSQAEPGATTEPPADQPAAASEGSN